jgi:hypothetical protein
MRSVIKDERCHQMVIYMATFSHFQSQKLLSNDEDGLNCAPIFLLFSCLMNIHFDFVILIV